MFPRSLAAIAAGAIAALVAWPFFAASRAPAAAIAPQPVLRDYLNRDRLIAFYERQERRNPQDQITARMLAGAYLQRFREQYDLGDITRAENMARRSIALQPQGNTAAQMALASALLDYHEFREALSHERDALEGEPSNVNALAQIASLQMELGAYDEARRTLRSVPHLAAENPTLDSIRARYDELTGKLSQARGLIAGAIQTVDGAISEPAYDRSWYHMRAAQLAFEAGDAGAAESEFHTSLDEYPDNAMALMFEAKMYRAQGRWSEALDAATRSASLYPLPQALGYEADAQRALGKAADARRTDALIGAEERLFNVRGINDRLLANYYAERKTHLDQALRAAQSDLAKRGNEVYADDTMAWVLARMGRYREAYRYSTLAVRTGITDPGVQYHAGAIALACGHRSEGRALIAAALRENPDFDPFESRDARALLTKTDG